MKHSVDAVERHAAGLADTIQEIRAGGAVTLDAIVAELNARGTRTWDGRKWTPIAVASLQATLNEARRARLRKESWMARLPPPSAIEVAIDAHRAAFGHPPGVWDFWHTGRFDELAAAIQAAVAAGVPFDEDTLKATWGMATGPVPPEICT